AGALAVDAQTLWRWKWDAQRGERSSLDAVGRRDGERGPVREPAIEPEAEAALQRAQQLERLRRELGHLGERDRLVLRLYDFEAWTLKEIAERLGVTESRVSQIRTRALGRLRDRLGDVADAA